jgi:hypothetical protein
VSLPRAEEEEIFIRVDGDPFFSPGILIGTFWRMDGGHFRSGKRNFSGIDAAEIGVGPARNRDTWKRHGLLQFFLYVRCQTKKERRRLSKQ